MPANSQPEMIQPDVTEIADELVFPEGPVWMPDGTLYVAELGGACVTKVDSDGTKSRLSDNGGSPNGLALGPDGVLWCANSGGWDFHEVMGLRIPSTDLPSHHSGGRLECIDLLSGAVEVVCASVGGSPLIGPNDLVVDAHGGIWFTDHGRNAGRVHHNGGVYYRATDGSVTEVVYPLNAPNGIGLSPDGNVLHVAETHTGRVFSWNVKDPGVLEFANPLGGAGGMLLHGFGGGQLLDSLAVDSEGNVVVATLVTGALSVIAPDGALLEQWVLGDPMVTNVCFGGAGLRTAYATLSGTGRLVSFDYPRGGLALNPQSDP
jgi:gluconolactonase